MMENNEDLNGSSSLFGNLTSEQLKALKAIIEGHEKNNICQHLDIPEETFEEWENLPEFNYLRKHLVHKAYEESVANLGIGAKEAVSKLREIISYSESEKIQLEAIKLLLQAANLHLDKWGTEKEMKRKETEAIMKQSEANFKFPRML